MSRLLSQDEVDALLSSFESGDAARALPGEVPYDLRAPLVLAGSRLGLVRAACDKLGPCIADAVTLLLASNTPVRGTFTGLVQQPASTVLGTLAPTEPLELIAGENGEPIGGFSVKSELGLAIVDRAQGGRGAGDDDVRKLSTVEMQLLESALARVVRRLDRHTTLSPVRPGGIEEDPVLGALAARGGVLATALFRLTTPYGDTVCRLMMTPQLANRLLAEAPVERRGETPERLKEALSAVHVALEPTIAGASMSIADLRSLEPGQVVQLDVNETGPLALRCNGQLLGRGHLQRSAGERVFEIDRFTAPAGPPAAASGAKRGDDK